MKIVEIICIVSNGEVRPCTKVGESEFKVENTDNPAVSRGFRFTTKPKTVKHLYSIIGINDKLEKTLIDETFDRQKADSALEAARKDFWAVQIVMDNSIIIVSKAKSVFPK